MNRKDSLKKGKNNIEMIILNILCENDYYGYQLTQLVHDYSKGMLSIPEGSLYPTLYRLEEKGYIHGEKRLVGKRLERIYYHIQPEGKEYLNTLLNDYHYLHEAIRNILSHSDGTEDPGAPA